KARAPDVQVLLVMDQAGWHRAKDLVIPANITAVSLPPYSPELNPVERVWLYLRERFLSHRWLEDYDAIVQACCQAWNAMVADPERLRSYNQLSLDPMCQSLGALVSLAAAA